MIIDKKMTQKLVFIQVKSSSKGRIFIQIAKMILLILSFISVIVGNVINYNQFTTNQFKKFDTNGDGYLDREEFSVFNDEVLSNPEMFPENLEYNRDAIFYNIWLNGKVVEDRRPEDAEEVSFGKLKVSPTNGIT